ncbi:Protein EXORDIUM-like 5 [Forsythia ovata]|uniref:Protein EXORDIUM-like 5 n=1 Tax=Forsythia ovata TaxID=205694 RepID=A0ABD1WBN3_9LAMI
MAPLIKDFLLSISTFNHRAAPFPSVAEWWRTVSLYTDQTGANISRSVILAGEYSDHLYSHGTHLTRLSIQEVIATAVRSKPFPVDHKNGIYLILTSVDVTMQDFCRAVCGVPLFHIPINGGLHIALCMGRKLWQTVPRSVCLPICSTGLHGRGWSRGAEPARPLSIACCAYILHFNRVSLDIKDLQNKTMTIIARNE